MAHYKGKIYSWVVANEVIEEDGTVRDSIWHKNFGTNFIAEAFRAAYEGDPTTKLYINDYNIEGKNKKSDGLYNLVKQLKAESVPIHGVGFQGHFIAGQVPKDFAANMKRFVDLGLEVAVTELDVRIKKPVTAQSRQQQAKDYAQAVTDCLSVHNCVGVTVWDFADKYTYIQNDPEWAEPALWDISMKPKEAVSAVEKVLRWSSLLYF